MLLFLMVYLDQCFCYSDYKSGFGGKFGVQSDRLDKTAVGWEYYQPSEKHGSQTGKIPEDWDSKIYHFLFACIS